VRERVGDLDDRRDLVRQVRIFDEPHALLRALAMVG
jgi:hypothetical protein